MADNILNALIPQNTWVDLYALTGITVGTRLIIENSGSCDVYLAVQAAEPDKDHKAYNVVKRPPSVALQNSDGDLGAWAYCQGADGFLSISTPLKEGFSPVIMANIHDGFGNPLSSSFDPDTGEFVLNAHDPDVKNLIENKHVHQHSDTATTLAAAVIGDGSEFEIDIVDATGFDIGNYIHINTSVEETTHPVILATTAATGPATFTLDRRLDNAHPIGDAVTKAIVNMASQNGTPATPQEYAAFPPAGEVWHITRFLFEMTHNTAGDLGKFGGIDALTNGVLIRIKNNGQYRTFTNWKRNGDIKVDMFDVSFDARSGGGGDFGTSGRGTFREMGAVVRLNGDTSDALEVYIQDTVVGLGLNSFTMKVQGHLAEG